MHEKKYLKKSLTQRNKRFRVVSEQRKTEELRGTGFFLGRVKSVMRSLTIAPCSLLRNRSETAPLRNACYILCRLKVSKRFYTPVNITITVIINIINIIEFRIKKNQSLQIAKISFSQNRPSARLNSPQTLLCTRHTAGFTLQNKRYFFSRFLFERRQAQGRRVERETRALGGRRGKLIKKKIIKKVAYLLASYQWLPFRVL